MGGSLWIYTEPYDHSIVYTTLVFQMLYFYGKLRQVPVLVYDIHNKIEKDSLKYQLLSPYI